MSRVGTRGGAAWWLSAAVVASLLASGALAEGAKQQAKEGVSKPNRPDTSLNVVITPLSISSEKLREIPVDVVLQAPVFPPLGHETRDEADRLRILNTDKSGRVMNAPYPPPSLGSMKTIYLGPPRQDTTYKLDGKPVIPAITRPDTSDRDFPRGVKRSGPPPITPPEAVQAGVSGSVVVRVYIDGEGKVTDAVVLSSPSPWLDAPALQSVRMSRFTPVMWDGKTVPCAGRVAVWFKPLPRTP